jgi:hypothetical protein
MNGSAAAFDWNKSKDINSKKQRDISKKHDRVPARVIYRPKDNLCDIDDWPLDCRGDRRVARAQRCYRTEPMSLSSHYIYL